MLYVTTRNRTDAHTSYRTLAADRGSDGGLFVPFRFPKYTDQEIDALREKPFRQCVAEMLNTLFGVRLDGWDIDFCIGRYPFRIVPLSHRIAVAETWRNPDWDFSRLVRNLSARLKGSNDHPGEIENWVWIAARIAVLFGLFSELERRGMVSSGQCMDIAIPAGDLSAAISAVYARKMGLPIGSVVCSCDEQSPLWELLHDGKISPAENREQIPDNLERLIFEYFGFAEAQRYVRSIENRRVYAAPEMGLQALRTVIRAVVVSQKRIGHIIPNVYRTSTYMLAPESALAYGGLLDHWATAADKRSALLLTERGPACDMKTLAQIMGLSQEDLKERINLR